MFVEVGLAKMALCGCVTLLMFIINLRLPSMHVCSFWVLSQDQALSLSKLMKALGSIATS